eukprot:UN09360
MNHRRTSHRDIIWSEDEYKWVHLIGNEYRFFTEYGCACKIDDLIVENTSDWTEFQPRNINFIERYPLVFDGWRTIEVSRAPKSIINGQYEYTGLLNETRFFTKNNSHQP